MQFKANIFFKTLVLFAATQLLGIYVAFKILPVIGLQASGNFARFTLGDFIYLLVIAFVFLFFSIKYPRVGAVIFRIFLGLIIFVAFDNFWGIWLGPIFSMTAALVIMVLFWIRQSVLIQDIVMIVTLASIGAVFGLSLAPIIIVYILIIFSVYDLVAVYVTGHMVKMAQVMVRSRAIFGFVIPSSASDFKSRMHAVQPGDQFMILGSGDVIFPLIMIASVARSSLTQALVVFVFSLLGLLATHLIFVNQKVRRPMAALPPIAGLTIIGYFVTRLF